MGGLLFIPKLNSYSTTGYLLSGDVILKFTAAWDSDYLEYRDDQVLL